MSQTKWEFKEDENAIYIYADGAYKVGPENNYVIINVCVGSKNGTNDKRGRSELNQDIGGPPPSEL